jgi:hypothetical protein
MPSAAQFRRNNCRDDRRRRLLADEFVGAGSKTVAGGSEGMLIEHRSQNYGDAEFFDEQPRLFELLPRRLWAIGLAGLLGLGAMVGLLSLHNWTPGVLPAEERLAAFDLAAKGSLANWLTTVGLLAAAAMAVAVYTIRRYKIDDYNGHYRIWLWAALCWTLISADLSASLHEGFQLVMIHITGTRLVGDGWVWWLLAYFFLVGAIGSRLAVDMWPARLSLSAFAAAAVCCFVGVANRAGWFTDDATRQVVVEAGAKLTGMVFLLFSMTLHARYVLMDAEGLLPRREPKPKKQPADDASDQAATSARSSGTPSPQPWLHADPPHSTPPQPVYRATPVPAAVAKSAATSYAASSSVSSKSSVSQSSLPAASSVNRKLTKQEKKALKERLLRERLQREGKWK